jgi:Circularly permutated YpsA SLOG family
MVSNSGQADKILADPKRFGKCGSSAAECCYNTLYLALLVTAPLKRESMRLERVISGGQTGADRAALVAARAVGIPTGGWMPKGYRAHDGDHPEFATLYGIRETDSHRYPPRTALNVKESDGTLRFATNWESHGEVLTLELCGKHEKPHFDVTPGRECSSADVAEWITANDIRVLNVAGNAEQTSPGIQEWVEEFLGEVFRLLRLAE